MNADTLRGDKRFNHSETTQEASPAERRQTRKAVVDKMQTTQLFGNPEQFADHIGEANEMISDQLSEKAGQFNSKTSGQKIHRENVREGVDIGDRRQVPPSPLAAHACGSRVPCASIVVRSLASRCIIIACVIRAA